MKYFSPSYWFKLWVLSAPLFNSENQGINAMSIDNKKIKNWVSNNTTNLDLVNEQLNLSNDNQTNFINYQNYSDIQQNNNLNTISPYKHHHEKSRNKHKRGINGGNEIEYGGGWTGKLYCSFKPEWWEEVVKLYLINGREDFKKNLQIKFLMVSEWIIELKIVGL